MQFKRKVFLPMTTDLLCWWFCSTLWRTIYANKSAPMHNLRESENMEKIIWYKYHHQRSIPRWIGGMCKAILPHWPSAGKKTMPARHIRAPRKELDLKTNPEWKDYVGFSLSHPILPVDKMLAEHWTYPAVFAIRQPVLILFEQNIYRQHCLPIW